MEMDKKTILLVQPSFYKSSSKPILKPPLGIAYLASSLEKKGHKIKILDMYSFNLNENDLINSIIKFKPDIVGFTVLTPFMKSVAEYSNIIKKHDVGIKIMVGGVHPSSFPREILEEFTNIDYIIFGEGELTISQLISGDKLTTVSGIVYRDGKKIIVNSTRPLIKNLDDISFPAWHLLDMEAYLSSYEYRWEDNYKPHRRFMILTTRGCFGKCIFCDSHRIWQREIRYRSVENIIRELKILKNKYNIDYFIINDDTFTIKKERVMEMCDSLIKSNLKLTWECKGRVNTVDYDMLKRMKMAGCELICYGAESGSQEVLNFVKKGITISQIKNANKITKKANIKSHFFWMMGFPIETKKHILETINLIKELKPDNCGLPQVLVPYPSTDIYDYMVVNDLILNNDYDSYWKTHDQDITETPIRTKYLNNSEVIELKRYADREIKKDFYKRMFFKYSIRPHLLLSFFINNPRFIIHYMNDALGV